MGGQAVQAADLVRRFRLEGLEVSFIPVNPELPGFLGRLQQIKYVRTLLTWPAYLLRLLCTVRKVDTLHVFSASYLSFLLAPAPAAVIGKLFGKRVILNYHSGEADDHLKTSPGAIRSVLRFVDQVVVPSDYLQEVFRSRGIAAVLIPNVVDTGAFPYLEREKFRPRFLVSRALEPLYNVSCVLRAFRIIKERFPDAGLTVLGSGSEEADLKALAAALQLQDVRFAGRIERLEIPAFYRNHDIMLNASNIDNAPLSILEAFASGLPVVSTAAGGIPRLIEHRRTGMLAPLDDHALLAAHAVTLVDDQALAQAIAREAHASCLRRFGWEMIRNQWLEAYGAR